MPDQVILEMEDSRGGPYLTVRVNGKEVGNRPLNPNDKVDVYDIGAMVGYVARELGAEVAWENTQVLYDARGNRAARSSVEP